MFLTLLLKISFYILTAIFWVFPTVSLPTGVVNAGLQMMSYWNQFLVIFPFAVLPTQIFLYVILPFEISLLVAKFFLANRLPANMN